MGDKEFVFATNSLRAGRMMRAFSQFVGVACLGLAGLAILAQFLPNGPDSTPARLIHLAVAASAVGVGARWLLAPWPDHRGAVAFVVWADCAIALAAVTMSTPEARLTSLIYVSLVGVFAAFLLSARILFVHCAFAAAVMAAIVLTAVARQQSSAASLAVFALPVLIWVVIVPLCGLVLIGSGRRAIGRTARSAQYDALTTLRNRRGMSAAVSATLSRRSGAATVVAVVCDIDRFKDLNDTHGHVAGDTALQEWAAKLREIAAPDDIAARIGGDELVLVGVFEPDLDIRRLLPRFDLLTRGRVGDYELTASVGVAAMSTVSRHFRVDDVIRNADSAMYEAKRSGGGRCRVFRQPDQPTATSGGVERL